MALMKMALMQMVSIKMALTYLVMIKVALTKMVFIREVKVRQSQNDFLSQLFCQKKRTFEFEFNYYDTSG